MLVSAIGANIIIGQASILIDKQSMEKQFSILCRVVCLVGGGFRALQHILI
jgi:formate/nitrite transporter FocA (FNT family)